MTLNLLLSCNQTMSHKPKTNCDSFIIPLIKLNHPNQKPISHKPNIVVDPTNPLHCYQHNPSSSIAPFLLLIVEIIRKEKKKLKNIYVNKEKKRWKRIACVDSLLRVFGYSHHQCRKKEKKRMFQIHPSLGFTRGMFQIHPILGFTPGGAWIHSLAIAVACRDHAPSLFLYSQPWFKYILET